MKKTKKPPLITEDNVAEFLQQAKLLHDCSYMQKPFNKVSLTIESSGKIKFNGDIPPKESLDSFLMTIRPFIEYEERLHVGRMITYLIKKYGESEFLESLKIILNTDSKFPKVTVGNNKFDAKNMMYLYLYGKYFHLDKDKQENYRSIEQSLGQYGEITALSQLERFAGIILGVAGYINQQNRLLIENK
ncbi:MAG: hypothetical protein WCX46_03510 [Candidatus Paceibacterota bacterium]